MYKLKQMYESTFETADDLSNFLIFNVFSIILYIFYAKILH